MAVTSALCGGFAVDDTSAPRSMSKSTACKTPKYEATWSAGVRVQCVKKTMNSGAVAMSSTVIASMVGPIIPLATGA